MQRVGITITSNVLHGSLLISRNNLRLEKSIHTKKARDSSGPSDFLQVAASLLPFRQLAKTPVTCRYKGTALLDAPLSNGTARETISL